MATEHPRSGHEGWTELGGGPFAPVRIQGIWDVPANLRLRRRFGSTKLDFTNARLHSDTVHIDLDVRGGSVEVWLPVGASLSLDRVETTLGSAEDHRHNKPTDTVPRFEVTGTVVFGSFEARGPRHSMAA